MLKHTGAVEQYVNVNTLFSQAGGGVLPHRAGKGPPLQPTPAPVLTTVSLCIAVAPPESMSPSWTASATENRRIVLASRPRW